MFWTRWVRGFCAAFVISVVGASVYYGKQVMDNVGGDEGYFRGMSIIAVAVVASLTVVSLILMISEIAININETNKKLDKLCDMEAKKLSQPQQMYVPQYQQPVYQPVPVPVYQQQYQQPAPAVQNYAVNPYSVSSEQLPQTKTKHSGKNSSWVCLCGNKNSAKAKFCGKCGLPKEM